MKKIVNKVSMDEITIPINIKPNVSTVNNRIYSKGILIKALKKFCSNPKSLITMSSSTKPEIDLSLVIGKPRKLVEQDDRTLSLNIEIMDTPKAVDFRHLMSEGQSFMANIAGFGCVFNGTVQKDFKLSSVRVVPGV